MNSPGKSKKKDEGEEDEGGRTDDLLQGSQHLLTGLLDLNVQPTDQDRGERQETGSDVESQAVVGVL